MLPTFKDIWDVVVLKLLSIDSAREVCRCEVQKVFQPRFCIKPIRIN